MLLLSVVLFNLNNPSIPLVYGDKGNNNNNNHNSNNKVKNHSLINSISDQVVNSNVGTNKGQVQLSTSTNTNTNSSDIWSRQGNQSN